MTSSAHGSSLLEDWADLRDSHSLLEVSHLQMEIQEMQPGNATIKTMVNLNLASLLLR